MASLPRLIVLKCFPALSAAALFSCGPRGGVKLWDAQPFPDHEEMPSKERIDAAPAMTLSPLPIFKIPQPASERRDDAAPAVTPPPEKTATPEVSSPKETEQIRAQREAASALMEQGLYEKAVEEYRRILIFKKNDREARCSLGTVYEKWAEKFERERNFTEAWNKYRDAVVEYKKALWSDPSYSPAYYGLGCVYARMGMRDDAVHYFKKVLEISAEGSELSSRARHNLRLMGVY